MASECPLLANAEISILIKSFMLEIPDNVRKRLKELIEIKYKNFSSVLSKILKIFQICPNVL